MGLRLGKAWTLEVGDTDGPRKQVHFRRCKGCTDRLVTLPDVSYQAFRTLQGKHHYPRLWFPGSAGSPERLRAVSTHMDRDSVQAAMKGGHTVRD